MIRTMSKNLIKSNKGATVVLFAVIFTTIAVLAALTVDIGVLALEKSRLSAAVDSAALAGAQELIANSGNTQNMVLSYLQKNETVLKDINILVDTNNHSVEVKCVKNTNYYFAKTLGQNNQDISATAKAKIENIKSLKGARPLAVVQQTFTYGKLYTLKEGAGDGTSGNYAAISLGGAGAANYRDNILSGYGGTVSVGDIIDTETGNIAGTTETSITQLINSCNHTPPCTYQSYNKFCPRIIFIPIVNTLDVNGKKSVKVLGFGTFFLEGVTDRTGHADVIGRFITYSADGETSSTINDYGTYGIKLVK